MIKVSKGFVYHSCGLKIDVLLLYVKVKPPVMRSIGDMHFCVKTEEKLFTYLGGVP